MGELKEKSDNRTDVTPEAAERPSDEGTDGHLKTGNIHKVVFTDGRTDPHVHEFRHQGRSYRLIKRLPSKNAAWHIQFELNGRRIHRSLKTNNAKVAEARAVT
ncbi:MAG TPA: hypothetical protein EYQ50_23935 [Verrucomicrobiales bacterium]|nr:hypothetical protein [Verrucomicrobiales bacterium]